MRQAVPVIARRVIVLTALGFAAGIGLGLLLRDPPVMGAAAMPARPVPVQRAAPA